MHKTKLEDMNLLENFLFESVLSYAEIGERFGRKLLEIIFGRPFGTLKVFPQKVYPGSDTNLHGARLDVYFEVRARPGHLYDQKPMHRRSRYAL